MNVEAKCPECACILTYEREESAEGWKCSNCGFEVVTTNLDRNKLMSDEENCIKNLWVPLYLLYYIDDVYDESMYASINIEFMQGEDDSKNQLAQILLSLQWAKDNPTYDFKSILPGLGYTRKQGEYSNEDIYFFLDHMYELVGNYLNKDE